MSNTSEPRSSEQARDEKRSAWSRPLVARDMSIDTSPETPVSSYDKVHTPASVDGFASVSVSTPDLFRAPQVSDNQYTPVRKFSRGGTELSLLSLLMDQHQSPMSVRKLSIDGEDVLDPEMVRLLVESFKREEPLMLPPGLVAQTLSSTLLPPGLAAKRPPIQVTPVSPLSPVNSGSVLKPDDTTVMLRNVPYESKQLGVLALLEEEGFKHSLTFVYAPLDFRTKNNLGYSFVVLSTPSEAKRFETHFDGLRLKGRPGWDKPLRVGRARIQGLSQNVEHYRNSPVNAMTEEFKPMLFEPATHTRITFPLPDDSEPKRTNSPNSVTVRPRERRLQSQLLLPSGKQNKLFIGGLSPDTTSASLWDYMSNFGRVLDAQVLMDSTTGRSRTYGFCTFSDSQSTASALAPNQHSLDGRSIVVRKYTSSGSTAH